MHFSFYLHPLHFPVPTFCNKQNRISIPLEYLSDRYEEIPMDKPVYVLCASGSRSATGASFLKNHGYESYVISGGMKAMRKIIR